MAEEESKHTLQVVLLVVDAAHGQGRRAYRRRHQPTVPGTRVKRDLIVATLNTCEGVWGGRAVRKWPRVRWEGRGEESASNDDSIKPSQSGLREDVWVLCSNE